jgi:hypothetical protein
VEGHELNVQVLTEKVISRLAEPRIAFLWNNDVPAFASGYKREGLTIIHYSTGKGPASDVRGGATVYRLEDICEPWEEYRYIHILVSVTPWPLLLQDLSTGIPATPEAQLVAGCLGNKVPVLFDLGSLQSWALWQGGMGLALSRAIGQLRQMGVSITSWPDPESRVSRRSSESYCTISEPGWYSWNEIALLLKDSRILRITEGVRLTEMALEMMKQNNITLEVMKG